ncbi:MAG: o-succinylbenzoate synthase [Cytophagaceae bacterium]
MLTVDLKKISLKFRFDAGTSRGVLTEKDTWFITLSDGDYTAIGECSPLRGLSSDDVPGYQTLLKNIQNYLQENRITGWLKMQDDQKSFIQQFPSIAFGLDSAFRNYAHKKTGLIFNNNFYNKAEAIPINGLVWMGNYDFMLKQVDEKVSEGYTCIKIKVGALDFGTECRLLEYIRNKYGFDEIELRLDANGAFNPKEVFAKLEMLSRYKIHSIEQPVKPGNYEVMQQLSKEKIIPVALDEELIGIHNTTERRLLFQQIRPQYIILKPSLIGTFDSVTEWIELAKEFGAGWWITSALESNIGLNAIAQFTAQFSPLKIKHGLGTGKLYYNNVRSPLVIKSGSLVYDPELSWDIESIN